MMKQLILTAALLMGTQAFAASETRIYVPEITDADMVNAHCDDSKTRERRAIERREAPVRVCQNIENIGGMIVTTQLSQDDCDKSLDWLIQRSKAIRIATCSAKTLDEVVENLSDLTTAGN